MDDKNRVILPSAIRNKLQDDQQLVITIGFDQCLTLFPRERFEEFVLRADEKGPSAEARKLRRKLVGKAREVNLDSQGRLVIPEHLKDEAGIEHSVTVVGNVDTVELWSPERWDQYLDDVDLEDAAQTLFS